MYFLIFVSMFDMGQRATGQVRYMLGHRRRPIWNHIQGRAPTVNCQIVESPLIGNVSAAKVSRKFNTVMHPNPPNDLLNVGPDPCSVPKSLYPGPMGPDLPENAIPVCVALG